MDYFLNEFQEKAVSVFIDRYGIDAGIKVIESFEKTGSLGQAMIRIIMTTGKADNS